MRILLSTGGTGGHVYPALAVAASLRAQTEHPLDLHLVGTRTGLERRLFEETDMPAHYLCARPLPPRKNLKWIVNAGYIGAAVLQARGLVKRLRPNAVVGTGGYASVPVLRAAQSLSVPTHVHELDAHAGRANRVLAGNATQVTAGFEAALTQLGRPDGTVTGNPLRPGFRAPEPASALERFGLDPEQPLILVFGGSQGAVALNRAVLSEAPAMLSATGCQILLVTGRGNLAECKALAESLDGSAACGVHLVEYVSEGMPDLMAAADLAITRAGAATVSELPAAGLPAILIPYPYSSAGHQRDNADALGRAGAGIVLDQDNAVQPGRLGGLVGELLNDKMRLGDMIEAARGCAKIDAAESIAAMVLEMAAVHGAEE